MMKILFILVLVSGVSVCNAFAPPRIIIKPLSLHMSRELSEEDTKLFERFGVAPEKVAPDVDLNEVLQWMGTYEDLIDKVDRDNKPFDRQQAQDEVDKLLLNRETLDKYIQFEKDKPRNAQEMLDAERATLQEPGTILTYVFWVLLFPVISYLQKTDFFDGLLGGGGGGDSLIQ